MNNPKALTCDYKGLATMLATRCSISAYNPVNQNSVQPAKFNALWDTGAMATMISTNVVNLLGLKPIGKARVFHANGESMVYTYLINILLQNEIEFHSLLVTEGQLSDTDVLIGMDIISEGDFAVTSSDGDTKMSFQVPSTHEIDFVQEIIRKANS
ncbi:MAG: retroviral-like aspartic protease family protein [Dysgonamonadaceae bacterium]|jgi:predicted aspartyl protease|nr:retroviral-like aspartic protease family protein [Dysgonamonadaceae bacterium]